MKNFLSDSGFSDKEIGSSTRRNLYRTRQESQSNGGISNRRRSGILFGKRAIYLLANGVEQIQFGTYVENPCYNGTIHNWFTMMGFVYNGIPEKGAQDCEEKESGKKFIKENCDGQSPCPIREWG